MNTIIPAIKHFWTDLSVFAKVLFATGNAVFMLVFILLIVSAVTDAESRTYYRKMIIEDHQKIDNICRNEPGLCENK